MTVHSDSQRIEMLQVLLTRSLPWLLRQQLPTGEFVSYRGYAGQTSPCASPLLSALALDALDCLDLTSEHFHERLFDLIPASDRAGVRVLVSTLRWRIRMHLAVTQEADGSWRRFGRHGDPRPCLATTSFATLMYLGQTLHPERTYLAVTDRLLSDRHGEPHDQPHEEVAGEIFAHRVATLGGCSPGNLPASAFASMQRSSDPVLALWAVAQASREGALACDAGQRKAMLQLTLHQLDSALTFRTRHSRAFGITILNLCHDGSAFVQAAIDRAITQLLADSTPPWRWPHEPLAFGVSSAPVTLALAIRSLAQAILAPQCAEGIPC